MNIPLKAAGYSSTYIYGEKDDAGWRFHKHNEIIQVLKTLSTVFALSGDEKYAVAAKDIMVQYANAYPNYELQQKGGRMYSQSLDEAVSMVDILQSYDLLCTSKSLTDSDRRAIELNLLRPSAETLINHPMNQSNWQAWHDAAIGMTGFILVLDWFFVSDDKKKHTYDWFMHGLGSLTLNIPLQKQSNPALALDYNHNGYEYLKSVNSGSSTEGIEVKWDQMGQGFHMYSVGTGSASKIFTAFGPGPSTNPNSYTGLYCWNETGNYLR